MPRAHLSRLSKLSPDKAAELFAQHHIVGLRQRKNGEIVKVKHATLGWLDPKVYYGLQKIHDLIPIAGPIIAGGYQMKWAIASSNINVAGVISVPVGGTLYATAILSALIVYNTKLEDMETEFPLQFAILRTLYGYDPIQELTAQQKARLNKDLQDEASVLLAGVFLPFGEIILLWAFLKLAQGKPYRWADLWNDLTGSFFSDFIAPILRPGHAGMGPTGDVQPRGGKGSR